MKISKLFHTLYAFLMFLPVMVLPLFAININQKEVDALTAQIEEVKVVNFNQLLTINAISSGSNHGITLTNNQDGSYTLSGTATDEANFIGAVLSLVVGHKYLFGYGSTIPEVFVGISYHGNTTSERIIDCTLASPSFYITVNPGVVIQPSYTIWLQCFDLTQMFGAGNEPTIQQFNTWYPNDYYSYTTGRKEILYTGVIDTLNNTDVGSQFLYSLYNPLKDYFNLPNYMNLGGLYDWFLLNLFSGYNSPVYFIIFDLMIYWLAMSILWLIFDVLMYVPSMIHKMLDKARME